MGDRICVLKDGVLQQVGTPRDLYANPTNVFVAGFIGSPAMNLFPGKLSAEGVEVGNDVIKVGKEVLDRFLRNNYRMLNKHQSVVAYGNCMELDTVLAYPHRRCIRLPHIRSAVILF
jgi:ABC-type sugar transport system ATPase subunit